MGTKKKKADVGATVGADADVDVDLDAVGDEALALKEAEKERRASDKEHWKRRKAELPPRH